MNRPSYPWAVRSSWALTAVTLLAAPSLALATSFDALKRLEPVPATEQIPLIDFFRQDVFANVQLNHPGTYVGAIYSDNTDHTSLVTYDLRKQVLDGVSAPQGDSDIASFTWMDGDHLIYTVSEKKMGSKELRTGEAGRLSFAETVTTSAPDSAVTVYGSAPDDRSQVLIDLIHATVRYDHVEVINGSNRGQFLQRYPELTSNHGFNTSFIPNKMMKLGFGIVTEDGVLRLSRINGEAWQSCPEDLDEIDVVAAGDEDTDITVLGPRDGKGPRPLEFMEAATGKAKDVILQDPAYDFDGSLFRDPKSQNIVGAMYDRAAPLSTWFTESYRNLQKTIDALFPGQVVHLAGLDDNGTTCLITSGSDVQPVVYSWIDLTAHKSGAIKNSRPWIDPKRMAHMGVLRYTTAEGKKIDAYLTLPTGASKTHKVPMVVLANADSTGRWTWGYDSEVQWLASRGYAVLQPNHRGAAGYTWMYPETEDYNYRGMTDDLAAATKKAIATGMIDGARVAISGQGFGGYLALSSVAFEPGMYKCAAVNSTYADYGEYIKADKYQEFSDPNYGRFVRKLGDPGKDKDKFSAMSPLVHAGDIHSALLIAWGEFDDPEMIRESKDMASAVSHGNNPSETLSYLAEANGLNHLDHRLDFYQHMEDFLAKNL